MTAETKRSLIFFCITQARVKDRFLVCSFLFSVLIMWQFIQSKVFTESVVYLHTNWWRNTTVAQMTVIKFHKTDAPRNTLYDVYFCHWYYFKDFTCWAFFSLYKDVFTCTRGVHLIVSIMITLFLKKYIYFKLNKQDKAVKDDQLYKDFNEIRFKTISMNLIQEHVNNCLLVFVIL